MTLAKNAAIITIKQFMNAYSVEWSLINMKTPKYLIDTDLAATYQGSRGFLSYNLYAEGDTLKEMIDKGSISEIDKDGDEICTYDLVDSTADVYVESIQLIHNTIQKDIDKQ